MNKIVICLSLFLLCVAGTASAVAVSSVRYLVRYNNATCRYDVLMYLETGDIQSGANPGNQSVSTNQVTLVVPTGSNVGGNLGSGLNTVSVVSNEPKTGSTLGGVVTRTSTPASWAIANTTFNPSSLSGSDVYAFKVPASGAFWPTAVQGDTLLLFSLTIGTTNCGSGIRLWNNNDIKGVTQAGGDPTSAASGMGGQDYNNGMDMHVSGVSVQTYNGNGISNVTPAKPTISAVTPTCTVGTFSMAATAAATACGSTLTYAWSGPNSFTAGGSSFTRTSLTALMNGLYTVTVTDAQGCTASLSRNILDVFTCGIVPLAIAVNGFEGTADKCSAVLNWQSSEVQASRKFYVEYSTDGMSFNTVGSVGSDEGRAGYYSFAYNQVSGKGYYRLRMMDESGKSTYSQIITVRTDCASQTITVSPNPTTGMIYVKGLEAGDEVKVVDMLGQQVASVVATGSVASTDLSRYPSAVYMVMVARGTTVIKVGQVVSHP